MRPIAHPARLIAALGAIAVLVGCRVPPPIGDRILLAPIG